MLSDDDELLVLNTEAEFEALSTERRAFARIQRTQHSLSTQHSTLSTQNSELRTQHSELLFEFEFSDPGE